MHAVGYRPRLSHVVLALVTVVGLGIVASRSIQPRSCPAKARAAQRLECPHTRARSATLADVAYRHKQFHMAERRLRDAAKCEPSVRVASELHVVASFYRELGSAWMRAQVVPYHERTVHLDAAIQLDAMLGGAHADELMRDKNRVLWAIGPK